MLWWILPLAGLAGATSFVASEQNRKHMEDMAQVSRNNAIMQEQEADTTRRQGEIASREKEDEKKKLKVAYRNMRGESTSLLSASNVDVSSGTALDVLEGNALRYASDMGELQFEKALTEWSYNDKAKKQEYQARLFRQEASNYERSAGSTLTSVLNGALTGATTFLTAYGMSGGTWGGLFGDAGEVAGGMAQQYETATNAVSSYQSAMYF